MARILITGGGGFLGAWVVRQLVGEQHDIRIFDRADETPIVRAVAGPAADRVEWIKGDITDTAAVIAAAQDCDAIIHLAALLTPACQNDPILGAQVNVIGTLNVFEAAKAHAMARVVYASSGAVFGPDDGTVPHPATQYGAFKLACEGCARAYWADAGIASVGFRPTIVYGPGRESGLTAGITLACREAAAGRPYTIGFMGAQDFLFVGDAAAAFAAAATRPYEGAHVFSMTGGTGDVRDVIVAIKAVIPEAAITSQGPVVAMASVITATPYDALLGVMPKTSLEDGIARTLAYYMS
jgi:nucleoside-diphosphate-sugar epimerase